MSVAVESPPWHAVPASEAVQRLEVDAQEGLSSAEAARVVWPITS